MFEMVKAIHEALHIESTWAFVCVIALAFGLMSGSVAWVVDKGYKNTLKEKRIERPVADTAPASTAPQPTWTVVDRGDAAGSKSPSDGDVKTEAPPTLMDLYASGFPNTIKVDGVGWNLKKSGVNVLSGPTKVYLDFDARTKFIAFYVPRSEMSYGAASNLWTQVQMAFDSVEKSIGVTGGYQSNLTDLKELTFSGRVFLYHEDTLSLRQLADLVDIYKAHGMALDFRGPAYLGAQVIAWHQKHDKR